MRIDCRGVVAGALAVDVCNVCGGFNTSCVDCSGIPDGGGVFDFCGVCDGDSQATTALSLHVVRMDGF